MPMIPRSGSEASPVHALSVPAGGAGPGWLSSPQSRTPPSVHSSVEIVVHVHDVGDVGGAFGAWMGAPGSRRWIEGFALAPRQSATPASLEYQAVLQGGVLSPWVTGGRFCGTRGQGAPLFGFCIRAVGTAQFDCRYSGRFIDGSEIGPLAAGTVCRAPSGAPLEAFRIVLQPQAPVHAQLALPRAEITTLGSGAGHYTAYVGPPNQSDATGATQSRRGLSREATKALEAGAEHYTAYVGPPSQYDAMGATQFRLLATLGLREHHRLLDFGCGSLRVGRLLIPYLLPGHYYGIEPNTWLIEDVIAREIGRDQIGLKQPVFRANADFSSDGFGVAFDFILAQSIFSHAGRDVIARTLAGFRRNLADGGLALVTFVQLPSGSPEFTGNGWVYPASVGYQEETIVRLIREARFAGVRLPWYHPRQTWYALAHAAETLPTQSQMVHLSGAVLRDKEFVRG
jgi:SAM-dependent methyltransferase